MKQLIAEGFSDRWHRVSATRNGLVAEAQEASPVAQLQMAARLQHPGSRHGGWPEHHFAAECLVTSEYFSGSVHNST